MYRRWPRTLSALSALTLVSALSSTRPLSAQDDNARVFTFTSGRPRIGVTVDNRADKDRDKIGARLQAVTPDGPAEKAGLQAGDIITRFNGVSLGGVKSDDEDESGPAAKLVELARKLEPGDTVDVEYRRGGDSKKARIVAQDLGALGMGHGFRVEVPRMEMLPRMGPELGGMPRVEGGPERFRVFWDGDMGGLALTDLNPELGEYFGAKEGVLVLETPRDSTLPLKAGDVIVSIDGRTPASEAHARRILRSYEPGETAKLEILRKQKKLTVAWKVPERDWKWKTPERKSKVKVERS
jgi:S1-C subfamily serine protease